LKSREQVRVKKKRFVLCQRKQGAIYDSHEDKMTVSVTVDIEKSNAEGPARKEISSVPKPVEQTALLTTEEQSQVIKNKQGRVRLSFLF